MVDFKSVSIVIPAYNEESSITELIKRIFAVSKDFELIVSSDGSTDATVRLAKDAGAIVVEHPYNVGNGAAVKDGALRATRDYIVFMDADLQHQPDDVVQLLQYLPEYDMVIGARTKESMTDLHRNIGNKILIKIAENISGHKINDLTSGFRAVKKELFLKFMHLYPLRYSYPTTSTLAFLSAGYFVKYVPLSSIQKRIHGESNIRPLKDGMRFIHIILRVIMTFHPMKIFLPITLTLFLGGIAVSVYQLLQVGGIRSSSIILLLSSVIVFLNGMLAEQISQIRRELNK